MLFYGDCATNIGSSRKNNQDAIIYRKISRNGQEFALGVVCDGIGGLEHGEAASQCVISAALEWFDYIAAWIDIELMNTDILFSHFKDAAEDWNRRLRDMIVSQSINTGTTMSAILLIRDRYFIVHVGDSRIYRCRGRLELMTTDEAMAKLRNGKMKLFLINYMGKEDALSFYSAEGKLLPGDIFVYGSDGFYHMFNECDMDDICADIGLVSMDKICESLIGKMMQRGERDNISVGIICCQMYLI